MTDPGKSFDASVGLAFSLKAFELYRKSGMLSAEIRSIPGIRGKCMAYLELIQGKVVACYLIDKTNERHSANLQMFIQLDTEKGPFGWIFHASPTQAIHPSPPEHSTPPLAQARPRSPVPQLLVHHLDYQQIQQWTPQQQQCINLIFSMIDGQRNLDELKAQSPFSSSIVDEVIRILLSLKVINLQ